MAEKNIWSVLAEVQDAIEQPKLNASVNYKQTRFRYADLSELWRVVRAAISGKGLFVHHTENGGYVQVVAHLGSDEAVLAQCPANLTGKPQDVGSALTYAKRYSLAMAFGLVAEEDDDGQRGAGQVVSDQEYSKAREELNKACDEHAKEKGIDALELKRRIAKREDFDGTVECMRRIASELRRSHA